MNNGTDWCLNRASSCGTMRCHASFASLAAKLALHKRRDDEGARCCRRAQRSKDRTTVGVICLLSLRSWTCCFLPTGQKRHGEYILTGFGARSKEGVARRDDQVLHTEEYNYYCSNGNPCTLISSVGNRHKKSLDQSFRFNRQIFQGYPR